MISFAIASCIENKVVTVRGDSMGPTFIENQKIILEKGYYSCKKVKPQKNEVVSFKHLDKDYLKRIVAVEEDKLSFEDGSLLVNGKATDIKLTKKEEKILNLYNPVPKNSVIVVGDNFRKSKDSRVFGAIAISAIIGKVP